MKKSLFIIALAALTGCAIPPSQTGQALVMQVNEPLLVASNPGSKTGKACAKNIFGIYTAGDISVEAAKNNGGIRRVATVDK